MSYNRMIRQITFISALLILSLNSQAQSNTKSDRRDSGLVQFSGLLLTADSLKPVAFAYLHVKHKVYGNYYSNLDGYFSFVARLGDTVIFDHSEYKRTAMVIPDSLKSYKYHVVKLMTKDTAYFPGTSITAMPSRAIFDDVFAKMDIPNDDVKRAKDNLEREAIREQAGNLSGADATEAYKNLARQKSTATNYAAGQIPPISLLSPTAWAQFFEAWKRGDYKRRR